ncbi:MULTISPECIES: hypothetical protein [unclassified Chelatococcus]|uniref:hypothetical protein n=1 Tax=unclassified Chelatococcus TaxID=2638111 RepID=UPI00031D3EB4|nr:MULTISPECIES: hypothetical protein [unclassified Chelatococcus]ALA16109.1 hypothetical protein AL346_00240 [Chelatococcus sp. CO-6]
MREPNPIALGLVAAATMIAAAKTVPTRRQKFMAENPLPVVGHVLHRQYVPRRHVRLVAVPVKYEPQPPGHRRSRYSGAALREIRKTHR